MAGTWAGGSGCVPSQVRGGLNWEFNRNWILSSELRYFGVGTPTLNGPAGRTLEAGYNTFDVLFGLTYRF
jgi:opacity protein-like surface antigen